MKRFRKAEEDNEINLTPMLDVVFILLIFFIVTTSFVKETGIDINRPSAATAEKKSKGNILIAIRPNGEIWIDNRNIVAPDHIALRPTIRERRRVRCQHPTDQGRQAHGLAGRKHFLV